jgi:two-component system sensor histidine kinase AgrC
MQNIIIGIMTILYAYLIADILLSKKEFNFKTILRIAFFSCLIILNNITSEPLISFILRSLIIIIFLSIEFFESVITIFSIVSRAYIIRFVFQILMIIVLKILKINTSFTNEIMIFTGILTLIFIYFFKDNILERIKMETINNKSKCIKYTISNIILFLIILARIPAAYTTFSIDMIIDLLLVFIVFNLALIIFDEKNKTENYIKNHQKIVEYSEFTEGLLTEYKSFIHEYKNKLIIIKDLATPRNKELHSYIDSILNVKASEKYNYLMDIKNIPIQGIKGLINYKLIKMKELNINAEVYVSESVATLKNSSMDIKEKNNLYTILGVILDNAIEASLESEDKMVSLQFFKEDNDINIILANTFKNVNLDCLEEKGFSTKGENRGIGLYLVKEIVKHSDCIKKETSIINNFFVQKIIIKNTK